jgi:L-histidine Nalpha-methyltransferase
MATQLANTYSMSDMAWEVRAGLTHPSQKELPSKYLYDEVGSALFEVICALPEYGLARADERLLRRHSHDIIARLPCPLVVAELGSGTGKKTRRILEALTRKQRTSYFPIEISPSALAMCKRELGDIERVNIVGCEREYLDGLREAVTRRRSDEQMLVLFLGSTIGNFDHPAGVEFLQRVRRILWPGDALLLGTDLEKNTGQLLLAYDDPLGVTAAFNLNLLARLNRDLDANFNLSEFKHLARFNPETGSVEMHLQSLRKQRVDIPAAELSVRFEQNETIWTESSHKYRLTEIPKIAEATHFRLDQQWIDDEWPFAESLLIAE